MTEQQWLASTDPAAMFRAIDPRNARIASKDSPLWKFKPSDRRLRLFACACCRQPDVWSRLVDDAECSACQGFGTWDIDDRVFRGLIATNVPTAPAPAASTAAAVRSRWQSDSRMGWQKRNN